MLNNKLFNYSLTEIFAYSLKVSDQNIWTELMVSFSSNRDQICLLETSMKVLGLHNFLLELFVPEFCFSLVRS